ncbi:MAG: beta-propeller domain-containing protein [Anaeroplasmataceae bacterium]|nr:beta-propeller domain-containing protein [Anaeroplasmataceae bacterium]
MKLKEFKKNLKTEYQNTINKKFTKREFHFKFKLRYAFLAVAGVVFAALLIQHFWVYNYNKGIKNHNNAVLNRDIDVGTSTELYPINTKQDYNHVVLSYQNTHQLKKEKTSILSYLFTFQFIGCTSDGKSMMPEAPILSPDVCTDASNGQGDNSYQTNTQVEGIDEADVAKCDGSYIYYLYNRKLYVYDLKAEKALTSTNDYGFELYIYNDKIISIGTGRTTLYKLDNNHLNIQEEINYERYLTSRLVQNKFYLASSNYMKEDYIRYEECYYDLYSNPYYLYSLNCYDLDTMESKETQLLSSYGTVLYASSQAFYFASQNRNFTSISIFSHDLEAVGVVKVSGYILNQFSMDEYEGYFRVVATDTTRNAEELNAITIFNLSDLAKVGYLDQGIGLERQTVKSVRFDKNTCYVVTYENRDPLYEIDCSNPENPIIISAYQAPGYSNYLHTFKIGNKEYVLGLGYTDSLQSTKISVYEKTEEETTQIGKDFVLAYNDYYSKANYSNSLLKREMFENHKALFIYVDDSYLYLGAQVAYNAYLVFKIDVEAEDVITIDKEIKLKDTAYNFSRLFLVENKIYVTNSDAVIVDDFS